MGPAQVLKTGSNTPKKTPSRSGKKSLGASPSVYSPAGSVSSGMSNVSVSQANSTVFDFSSIETPDITTDEFVSPLNTPVQSNGTPDAVRRTRNKTIDEHS